MSLLRSRAAAHPLALVLSTLLLGYFLVSVLPAQSREGAGSAPEGGGFDMSFAYSPSEALDRASRYSPEARLAAISGHWGFDLVWPLVYGLFCFTAWSYSLARLGAEGKGTARLHGLSWLALLGTALDYAENIAVTGLLASYPATSSGWALAASVATPLKWLFVGLGFGGSFALLGIAAVQVIWRKIKASK